MGQYHDIDVYGETNPNGTIKTSIGDEAIKNALVLWLMSRKGDFVNNPEAGGILDDLLFKNLKESAVGSMIFKIKNAINNEFTPSITLENIDIIPDYEAKMWVIEIDFTNPTTGISQNVQIYTKDLSQRVLNNRQNIDYTGENLQNFCLIKSSDMSSEVLKIDTETGEWHWGDYYFTNFSQSSSNFATVLAICNT